MRKTIAALLLAATMATPLAAQGWQDRSDRQERRENRREIREGRQEVREQRREVAREARQGDWRGFQRERAELRRDQAELRRDQREAWRDRQAVRNGTSHSWAERQRDWRQDRRDDRRDWRDDRRDWRSSGWNRDWRNDDRYDWRDYRNRYGDRYRAPRYYGPRGYSYEYRRWSPGYRVQPYYYGRSYWISDPYRYRLPPAHGYYRWVRYHDDVMLVDIRNGLIADIIYSFFW